MFEVPADSFCPDSRQAWRQWLHEHHASKQSVWLLCYKTTAGVPTISWSDAVDEALCYGWIDSVRKSVDGERFIQFFSRRKPASVWSKINKAKVERLIAAELMMPAGHKCIETARQNGSWNILDAVEELHIPEDLENAFATEPVAREHFLAFSKSTRKAILQWLVLAKRSETRQKRIAEIVSLAGEKLVPLPFRRL